MEILIAANDLIGTERVVRELGSEPLECLRLNLIGVQSCRQSVVINTMSRRLYTT